MSVTKKFFIIAASGALFSILLNIWLGSLGVFFFVVFNITLAVLFIVDSMVTPGSKVILIAKSGEEKLFLKAENTIEISIKNNHKLPLLVEAKDNLPCRHFSLVSEDMKHKIPEFGKQTFSYRVIPSKRGSFISKSISIRVTGVLGFCRKQYKFFKDCDYKVYPNLSDLSRYRLIMSKKMLDRGDKPVSVRGLGYEFESLREYVDGDDYRKVNWMATARENKLIVNQYETEKNQPIFIMLDTGRPLSYSVNGYYKLDYSINAALILSDIVNQKNDLSGLAVFNTSVDSYIKPGKGVGHRNNLMETLYHVNISKDTSDYEGAFNELYKRQSRRSIIFIMSDFETIDEAREITKSLKMLSKKHIPILLLMKNESAEKLAKTDDISMKGIYDRSVAMDYLLERKKIIRILNQNNIACVESTAENFTLTAINKYLSIKNGCL